MAPRLTRRPPGTGLVVLPYRMEQPMDYHGMVKRLQLPAGFEPPTELTHDDVCARALTRADLDDDVRGINASLDLIRRTRGGQWPTEPVTHDYNYVDAVWHECEFRDHKSLTYTLRRPNGRYLGCLYLYPIGTRTPLSDALLASDVDVSWWVTPEAYDDGLYPAAYGAIKAWLAEAFPFWTPHFSNAEIPAAG
jgi:hypothetical protein